MSKAIVIGGGIIGLSSAWYLREAGADVTVVDPSDLAADVNNASHVNAGYVCPSHFVPLAAPGIVKQGLKWMFNPESPFYIKPSLDRDLLHWAWKFIRCATAENVERAAVPLRDIALLSQRAYEDWTRIPGFDLAYEHKGILEIFQTEKTATHAHHLYEEAQRLNLDMQLLDAQELAALEPGLEIRAAGALLFRCDAHLYPQKVMRTLFNTLREKGVEFIRDEAEGVELHNGRIQKVITKNTALDAQMAVLAAGAWSNRLSRMAGVDLPLVPGRGYSLTLENPAFRTNYPAILAEARVAITPMDGNKMRYGGTMEITRTDATPQYSRMNAILDAVQRYYPAFTPPAFSNSEVRYGYRPCSADGLPYIGKAPAAQGLVIATGHSMLGMSLGPGTGKLVSELLTGAPLSMDIRPFAPDRF